jgi:phenylalanyl-tRNA synthetase alpha chain
MSYQNQDIIRIAEILKAKLPEMQEPAAVLRSPELKSLYDQLKTLPPEQKSEFGKEVNELKQELMELANSHQAASETVMPIDVTAPWGINVTPEKRPRLLAAGLGGTHPVMQELERILDIFSRMGFGIVESREIDDDFHMFGSLNFPEGHPARDDYDSFMTEETDSEGKAFIAPAHTSTMQNRVLKEHAAQLEAGEPIAAVVPGRVFRNEDLDARHEHTFYQIEGIFVDTHVHVGHLMATLKAFIEEYYGQELEIKTQPFYFPFTEPSFEFALSCPFCQKAGCNVCSYSGWIELLGCGMIHPNVLKMAGIDPGVYTGFAWGVGFMRMVMIKYGIEDIRHFTSGKIEFLRQFS